MFEDGFRLPLYPANSILGYASEMHVAIMNGLVGDLKEQIYVAWYPLKDQWIKLNTDGNFWSASMSASSGGALRNNSGVWI